MWPAIIAGGAALLGGAMGNKSAKNESRRNRAFQERMRNTQWQAAVADMEAAGINPALAYSQGPAASPGGSMASQSDVVSPAISSAMQFKQAQKQLRLLDSQIRKTDAEAGSARIAETMARATAQIQGINRTSDGSLRIDLTGDSNLRRQIEAQIELLENQGLSAAASARQLEALAGLSNIDLEILQKMGGLPRILTMFLKRR